MKLVLAVLMIVIVSIPSTATIPYWEEFVVNVIMSAAAIYLAYQAGRSR